MNCVHLLSPKPTLQLSSDGKASTRCVEEEMADGKETEDKVSKIEENDGKEKGNKQERISNLIKRLGYRHMTFDIFHKMRETFGTEECEYCGRLFYNKVDHENHVRTHTGR